MVNVLARSSKLVVFHESEGVILDRKSGPSIEIGDFYGEPTAAVIDAS